SPDVAVVTNISENHLDRHGTLKEYIRAKKNILRFQSPESVAVLNWDDPEVRTWQSSAPGNVVFYSCEKALDEGVFAEDNCLVFRLQDNQEKVELPAAQPLLGKHNLSNILAAAAAARVLGTPPEDIVAAVASFSPLPHRLQPVGETGGVLWVNDSKGTTPAAVMVAIEAFEQPIVLIAGGYDKKVNLGPMAEVIAAGVRAVVLMGETADTLEGLILGARGSAERPEVVRVASLSEAVAECRRLARAGDVVLLSTGHASWDMFENYEERGEMFVEEVKRLAKGAT
ncbi:MAG: UDP-N-acetylmuramoyl-L-alanine--D-glutamate ligase, partial [Phycisphaerae bacterium]|nr:UDP-N-acetylmuramoyl-L-alanine--D-glutamate ligase [Phycisphaerae bacterium]